MKTIIQNYEVQEMHDTYCRNCLIEIKCNWSVFTGCLCSAAPRPYLCVKCEKEKINNMK